MKIILFIFFNCLIFSSIASGSNFCWESARNDQDLYAIQINDLDTQQIKLLIRKGEYISKTKPDSSLIYFQMALFKSDSCLIANQESDSENCCFSILKISALNSIGYFYSERENIQLSDSVLKTTEKLINTLLYDNKCPNEKRSLLENLGICYNYLGLNSRAMSLDDTALFYLNKSLLIRRKINDKRGLAATLNNLGLIHEQKGNFIQALKFYNDAAEVNLEMNNRNWLAVNYNNLGSVYQEFGDMEKAIDYLEKSLKIKKETGNSKGIAITLNTLGILFKDIGLYDKAESYTRNAVSIFDSLKLKQYSNRCKNTIGGIFLKKNEFHAALDIYSEIAEVNNQLKYSKGLAEALNNIGICYKELGDIEKSKAYYIESLKISKSNNYKNNIVSTNINIGNIYLAQDKIDSAEYYYLEAKKVFETSGAVYKGFILYSSLIELYIKTYNYKKALEAVEIISEKLPEYLNNNFSYLSSIEKYKFLESLNSLFYTLNYCAITFYSEHPEISSFMFNNLLLKKGILLSSATSVQNAIMSSEDSTLIEKYEKWRENVDQYYLLSESPGTEKRVLDSITNITSNQEKELSKLSGIFSKEKNLFSKKWQDCKNKLKDNEAIIEFTEVSYLPSAKDSSIIYALIITKQSKSPKVVRLCYENELLPYLFTKKNKHDEKSLKELYKLIWYPLDEFLKGKEIVYFSPFGKLHLIPFAALKNTNNRFLFENYELHQQITSRTIGTGENKQKAKKISLYGNIDYGKSKSDNTNNWEYLPGSKEEAENIIAEAKNYSVKTNFYFGTTVDESAFLKDFNSDYAEIYHFATHGFFLPELSVNKTNEKTLLSPLQRSGIVLSNANLFKDSCSNFKNDGLLTGLDLAGAYSVNTKLVVLSACETGRGVIEDYEGVIGLQRAFLMAGVKKLIVSLWKIPDKETTIFMTEFYKHYFESGNIFDALNKTRKIMSLNYPVEYWGAFVLVE